MYSFAEPGDVLDIFPQKVQQIYLQCLPWESCMD